VEDDGKEEQKEETQVRLGDDLIDELPVEKQHLSKLIIICRI